jgi:hypothetical protein
MTKQITLNRSDFKSDFMFKSLLETLGVPPLLAQMTETTHVEMELLDIEDDSGDTILASEIEKGKTTR